MASRTPLSHPLEHIHGAAFDRATSAVIVATHNGAWWVNTVGTVSAAGDTRDDLMGFTVEQANRWLSSGHPGPDSAQPNPLGLIESRDQGRSWSAKSESGIADFHTLASRGDIVVGSSGSNQLNVSTDGGKTWGAGATTQPTALVYAGVRLLAVTATGLSVSDDDAQSFLPLLSAPHPVLISAVGTNVWIAERDGTVSVSTDAGQTWTSKGIVTGLQSLAAVDDAKAVALTAESILVLR
ncbi:MAG: sialidase family protein [Candidatus Nanopelagicales bacterium]